MALLEATPPASPQRIPSHASVVTRRPTRAAGIELLGPVAGSGYRKPPSLVRRGDGQILQLTPILYALLESVDDERDITSLAEELSRTVGKGVAPDHVHYLIEQKLRPLGVLLDDDGAEPVAQRANPLLALRCRFVVSDPELTERLTAPFARLFHPTVVFAVVASFLLVSGWLLFEEGLAGATRAVLYQPALLLTVFVFTMVSAGFHELGHAAACRYGGARPGAMGVGLYLVSPAFYTDVSDSYRLDRRGRLRVDLGGLYFNAVFAVATFAVWTVTRADALLVMIPLQQLQMLRQLLPFVRLDGYHILADLTGVPDLFAQARPILTGWLTWRRRSRGSALRPWTRVVVTAWCVFVIPVLALTLLVMVVTLPRLAATAAHSVVLQWDDLVGRWQSADVARGLLGAIGIAALIFPVLSVSYLVLRVTKRTARRIWRGTDGHPLRRSATLLVGAALAVFALSSWWPSGQYEAIRADERGTVADGVTALTGGDAAGAMRRASFARSALPASVPGADSLGSDVPLVVLVVDPTTLDIPLPSAPFYDFALPAAPGPGDNQALALNRADGTVVNVARGSLVWVFDGVVDSANEAWALSNCRSCGTQAVAFQVVLVVGTAQVVSPSNVAVAVNANCSSCVANAIARQLVLTLDSVPSDEELTALAALWQDVETTLQSLGSVPIDETLTRLEQLELEMVEVLAPSLSAPPTSSESSDSVTTTSLESDTEESTTTSTTPPTTEAPTTTEPATTTTTAAPPTTQPPP